MQNNYGKSIFSDSTLDVLSNESKLLSYELLSDKYSKINDFLNKLNEKYMTEKSCSILKEMMDEAYLKAYAFNFFNSTFHNKLYSLYPFISLLLKGQYQQAFNNIPNEVKNELKIDMKRFLSFSKDDVREILLTGLIMCVSYNINGHINYNDSKYNDSKNEWFKDKSFETFIDSLLS